MKPRVKRGSASGMWCIEFGSMVHWEPSFAKIQDAINSGKVRFVFEGILARRRVTQAQVRVIMESPR